MKSIVKSNLISLRSLVPQDIDFLLELENDSSLWYASDNVSLFSKEDLENFIHNAVDIFHDNQQRFIIQSNQTLEPLGILDLFNFNAKHQYVSIGIIIKPIFQKKGFAKDAINACKKMALQEFGIRNITASIASNNLASIHLFESVGFEKVGVRKNWFLIDKKKYDELIYQFALI